MHTSKQLARINSPRTPHLQTQLFEIEPIPLLNFNIDNTGTTKNSYHDKRNKPGINEKEHSTQFNQYRVKLNQGHNNAIEPKGKIDKYWQSSVSWQV